MKRVRNLNKTDLLVIEQGDKLKINGKIHTVTAIYHWYSKIVYELDGIYDIPKDLLVVEEINGKGRESLL